MAGLLDFIETPIGQGLLSAAFGGLAGARSGTPLNNIGRAGVAGLAGYSNAVDKSHEEQMKKLQMEQLKAAMAEKSQKDQFFKLLMGGNAPMTTKTEYSPVPGDSYMPAAEINPANAFVAKTISVPQSSSGGTLASMTPDQIAAAKMIGVDLSKQWEIAKQGFEQKAGSYYLDPTTNQRTYLADPVKGISMDSSGNVGIMPGWSSATAQQTIAQKLPEQMIAAAGRVNLRTNPDGTQTPVSELSENPVLRGMGQYLSVGQAPVQGGRTPSTDGAAPSSGGQTPASGGQAKYGISSDQAIANAVKKEEQITQVQNDAKNKQAIEANKALARKYLDQAAIAEKLLKSNPSSGLFSSMVDKTLGAFNIPTESGKIANSLDAVGGWLVSNVPRMEGPQSNFDVENYKTMAGNVANRDIPIENRLKALNTIQGMMRGIIDGSISNQPGASSGGATGGWGDGASAASSQKVATMADIRATAYAQKKSVDEVLKAAKSRGYTVK